MNIYYSIVKTYKGLLKKKHSGNVHILTVPSSQDKFSIYIIIGKLKEENNIYVLQLIGSGPISYVKNFLSDYGLNEKGFMNIEKIKCSITEKDGNEFFKLDKKGKYILSNFEVEYKPEFSSPNSKMFFLTGKLNPLMDNEKVNDKQMKMVALKKTSMLQSIKNWFKKEDNK